jgi:hypothetical protein
VAWLYLAGGIQCSCEVDFSAIFFSNRTARRTLTSLNPRIALSGEMGSEAGSEGEGWRVGEGGIQEGRREGLVAVQLAVDADEQDVEGHDGEIQEVELGREEGGDASVNDPEAVEPEEDLQDQCDRDAEVDLVQEEHLGGPVQECAEEEVDQDVGDQDQDQGQGTEGLQEIQCLGLPQGPLFLLRPLPIRPGSCGDGAFPIVVVVWVGLRLWLLRRGDQQGGRRGGGTSGLVLEARRDFLRERRFKTEFRLWGSLIPVSSSSSSWWIARAYGEGKGTRDREGRGEGGNSPEPEGR